MSETPVYRLDDWENWPEEAKELIGPDGRPRVVFTQGQPHVPVKQRGRPPEYPWEFWMNGQQHRVVKGVDYQGQTKSFRNYLTQKAIGTNLRFTSTVDRMANGGEAIRFRYTKKTPPVVEE